MKYEEIKYLKFIPISGKFPHDTKLLFVFKEHGLSMDDYRNNLITVITDFSAN